jgi:hypothetical protein
MDRYAFYVIIFFAAMMALHAWHEEQLACNAGVDDGTEECSDR